MNMHTSQAKPVQLLNDIASERVLRTTQTEWSVDTPYSNLVDFAARKQSIHTQQPETFSVVDLKERGWTKTMMDLFLSGNDVIPTSGAAAGRPKQLYLKSLILKIEAQDSFKARCLAAIPRRQTSNALYNEKAERLVALVAHHKFQVPDMPLHDLRLQTIQKFGEVLMPSQQLSNEVLFLTEPIEMACSDLHAFTWNYGVRDARQVLRKRIYVAVMEQYPHLSRTIFHLCRIEMS
jgi:hypothetical protein